MQTYLTFVFQIYSIHIPKQCFQRSLISQLGLVMSVFRSFVFFFSYIHRTPTSVISPAFTEREVFLYLSLLNGANIIPLTNNGGASGPSEEGRRGWIQKSQTICLKRKDSFSYHAAGYRLGVLWEEMEENLAGLWDSQVRVLGVREEGMGWGTRAGRGLGTCNIYWLMIDFVQQILSHHFEGLHWIAYSAGWAEEKIYQHLYSEMEFKRHYSCLKRKE